MQQCKIYMYYESFHVLTLSKIEDIAYLEDDL